MTSRTVRQLIDEWSEAAGTDPWAAEEVVHFEMDGTTVGFVPSRDGQGVNLYVDLGFVPGASLQKALLWHEALVALPPGACFALQGTSGHLVLRLRGVDCKALAGMRPQAVQQSIAQARQAVLA
jgi:hypothetical protein